MMKMILAVIALTCVLSVVATAQNPTPQEGSRVAAPAGWCQGCSDAQKQLIISQEDRGKNAPSNDHVTAPSIATSNPHTYASFTTNFLVSNNSNKKIKRINWETTLINRETNQLIQTFSFVTKRTVAPHKELVLKQNLHVPMSKLLGPVVTAGQPGAKTSRPEVLEQYRNIEIEYKNGSIVRP